MVYLAHWLIVTTLLFHVSGWTSAQSEPVDPNLTTGTSDEQPEPVDPNLTTGTSDEAISDPTTSAPVSDDPNTAGTTRQPNILQTLGEIYNIALLKILGKHFSDLDLQIVTNQVNMDEKVEQTKEDIETELQSDMEEVEDKLQVGSDIVDDIIDHMCQTDHCTEWTKWSTCVDQNTDTVGISTRSRTCGIDVTICPVSTNVKVRHSETDWRFCEVTEAPSETEIMFK